MAALSTVFGAILFYFGWSRSSTTFGYFGIGQDLLDLSFRDYVLRSANATFRPLLTALAVAFAAISLHRWQIRDRQSHPAVWIGVVVAGGLALAAAALGFFDWYHYRTNWPMVPLLALCGSILLAYGIWLRERRSPAADDGKPRGALRLLVVAVLTLTSFWTIAGYSQMVGLEAGRDLARNLQHLPAVTVGSATRLDLDGPGVTVQEDPRQEAAYHYSYSGLRLLIRSGGRYFLVPDGWRRGEDQVFIVTDTGDIGIKIGLG
ncbi:hypothetical protein [Pseudofrankia sp. DC12]|uniref:hypothetical protein n=1 Tax=Pseudofrankia sp. DC12 TaxID=683315 RepID=UPI0005F83E32|nr:hypothetical protein [Pseudofrankia sp. DC12]